MIELGVVVLLFVGLLWLAASMIGLVFKLTFAMIGGLFGLVAGALGLLLGGVMLLLVAPIVALALLPFCLPVFLLVALVWAIARSTRHHAPATVHSASR
jgi:hypothetical protein